jgi:type IV pilus assembly protein PilF
MRSAAGAALTAAAGLLVLAACTTTTTTKVGGEVVSKTTNGRPDAAATAASNRSRARARTELAAGYFRTGQLKVALEEARRAVQIDPTYADGYGLLGLIFTELDDRPAAEENFRRALQLEPNNPDLNNNYGWFLCQTGRQDESVGYFQRALKDPLYATPARANMNAGVCLARVRNYAAAEPYLRRAFELDAANPTIKFELASLYLATNQPERAAFYYGLLTRSVDASPETLWLGIKVARAQGDLRTESRLAAELRSRFPSSREAGLLARGAYDE